MLIYCEKQIVISKLFHLQFDQLIISQYIVFFL